MRTIGTLAQQTLHQREREVSRALGRLSAERAADAVHDVRVGLRRLQAAVVLFDDVLDLPRKLRPARLRRALRVLGPVRNADVAGAQLANLRTDQPEDVRLFIDQRTMQLHERRERQLDRLLQGAWPGRMHRLLDAVHRWRQAPRLRPVAAATAVAWLPTLVLPALAKVLRHPGWWTNEAATTSSQVHALRRSAKLARYQLDVVYTTHAASLPVVTVELRQLQDLLGGIRDAEVVLQHCRDDLVPAAVLTNTVRQRRAVLVRQWERLRSECRRGELAGRWWTALGHASAQNEQQANERRGADEHEPAGHDAPE